MKLPEKVMLFYDHSTMLLLLPHELHACISQVTWQYNASNLPAHACGISHNVPMSLRCGLPVGFSHNSHSDSLFYPVSI